MIIIRELLIEKWTPPDYISGKGDMYWFDDYSKEHSLNDRPAIILVNGCKAWCKNGHFHRDGNKPAIIYSDKLKEWWINGEIIR